MVRDPYRLRHSSLPTASAVVLLAFLSVPAFPAPSRSYMDYYTLVTPEFVTKLVYDELKRYTGN